MANKNEYLGGVLKIKLLDIDTGDLAVEADSLTESTFTASSEGTEVRGGQGYKLFGKYYHTSSVTVALTDALYRPEYVAMKVGSAIEHGDNRLVTEKIKITSNKGELPTKPEEFDGNLICWVKQGGTWITTQIDHDNIQDKYTFNFTAPDDTEVCVRYIKFDVNGKKVTINANFVPSVYHLIGVAQRFRDGKFVGTTEFDIPRFQLDPSFELSMSSNGVSNMNVSGSALPVENETTCEDSTSYYCTVTDYDKEGHWYDDAKQIYAYPPTLDLNTDEKDSVEVSVVFNSPLALPARVDKSELEFSIPGGDAAIATVDAEGIVTAVGTGETKLTITAKDKPELTETVVVTVA